MAWCALATGWLLVAHLTGLQPPLIIHSLRLLSPIAYTGGTVEYEAIYTKRAACYPPRGAGEVSYRFEVAGQTPDERGALLAEGGGVRRAEWKPGARLIGAGAAIVPVDLKSGDYIVEATATYTCDDRSWPVSVRAPPMRVRILRQYPPGE